MAKFDHAVIYGGKLYKTGEEVPVAKKRKSKTNSGVSKNDVQSNSGSDSGAAAE